MAAISLEFLYLVGLLILAALYLPTLIFALRRASGQEFAASLLGLYALTAMALTVVEAFWHGGSLAAMGRRALTDLQQFGALFLAFLLILITRTFLRREAWSWLIAGIVLALGLAALGSDLLTGLPVVIWTNGRVMLPRERLPLVLTILGWIIFTGGALWNVQRAFSRQRQPLHRNRLSYWLPAFILILVNDAMLLTSNWVPGNPLRLAATILIGYVVLTHNLPDSRLILRRVLIYIITTLLIAGFYILGTLATQPLRAASNYNPLVIGAGIALLLAMLFTPLLSLVRRLVDRWLRIEETDAGRTLHQYSESISNILDMQRLASVAVGIIIESMELTRGFLFLVDTEVGEGGGRGYRLRAARTDGERQILPIALDENSPIARHLLTEQKPLLQYDLDLLQSFRGISSLEREWFNRLETEVYVPIFASRRWIGLLALGAKLSGNRYSADDLVTLAALANQTAVALENARLVENLMRLNQEVRQAYRDLDKANRDLERLDQTKSDFISIASHELRTPLTVMRGYTEMLLEDSGLNPNVRAVVKSLHDATMRLHEIMDSMFDIAQIDTRTLQLHLQSVDTAALVQEVSSRLAKNVLERKLSLTLSLPPLPTVKADPNILKKVFSHLLANAIKFTPDGGNIEIIGHLAPSNGNDLPDGGIQITVKDTGVGVDPSFQEVIFTKFYQPGELGKHSTSKSRFKGSGAGLGLALSKGIVEAHGGRIWVESTGHDEAKCPGSQFHVVLPLARREEGKSNPMGNAVSLKIDSNNGSGGR
ncbi:MAG: GAF domain-containing sensor histidine kinase [Chloroflexota bacterium]